MLQITSFFADGYNLGKKYLKYLFAKQNVYLINLINKTDFEPFSSDNPAALKLGTERQRRCGRSVYLIYL